MAWVEAHQALRDHRKVLELSALLDMQEPHVVGHLLYLWLWSLDNAPDGILPSSDRIVERAAGWTGERGQFLQGLIQVGLVDVNEEDQWLIHDWHKYGGKLVEKRTSDAQRKREERAAKDIQTMSNGHPQDITKMSQVEKKRKEEKTGETTDQVTDRSSARDTPSSLVTPELISRVEEAANLKTREMAGVVAYFAPRLLALDKDIVDEAECWRHEHPINSPNSGLKNFRNWLFIALKEDSPSRTTSPPSPAVVQLPNLAQGYKRPERQKIS